MSDLISRKEAIKTLQELWRETNDSWYEEVYNMAIESLSAEASAETHGVCSDIISREEVLRVIITAGEVEPDLGYTHLHDVIKSLPSAEPKTDECKYCTHWQKLNYEAPRQGWCNRFKDWTDADEYCSRCVRRRRK